MEETQELVGTVHVPDEGIPGRVGDAIPETREREGDDEDGVWWVYCDDDIREQMAA
jgi:hypothetical protein